jgi:ribosome maturation factor RimP
MNILEILVDGDDIDASSLGAVNESINEAIDEYLLNNYYLEVSTAGAIRVLNSLDQVKRQVGKYLRVTKDNKSIKGVLEKVEDDTLFIKINDKGRIKVIETSFSEADEVELTVKF